MLTFESIQRTQRQMTAYGEGRHTFANGTERTERYNAQSLPPIVAHDAATSRVIEQHDIDTKLKPEEPNPL